MTEDQVRQTLEHIRVEDMSLKDTPLPVHAGPLLGARLRAPVLLAGLRVAITYASLGCLVLSWLALQAM